MNLITRLLCTCRRRWLLLLGILVCVVLLTLSMNPEESALLNLLTTNP